MGRHSEFTRSPGLVLRFRLSILSTLAIFIVSLPVLPQTVAVDKVERGKLEQLMRQCPEGNALRCARLQEYFRELGCRDDLLTTQPVKGSPEPNIIATLPGSSESRIIVGAHFDYSTEGDLILGMMGDGLHSKSAGAIDNWSGAVLLPVLYQTLGTRPRTHTFVFIGFAAEETGLKGSKSYAKSMTPEDRARTRAEIDLDCLGIGITSVWVKRSDPGLWESIKRAAAVTRLPLRGINMSSSQFGSNSDPFRKLKIPTIAIHSVDQDNVLEIHSFMDSVLSVRWKEYYDSYLLIAAFLGYLDLKLK